MKSATLCIDKPAAQKSQSKRLTNYPRQILLKRLQKLQHGELVIVDGDEEYVFGQHDEVYSKTVTVTINDPVFYSRVLIHGALGGGHAYIQGHWTCDDLTGMVELFLCNRRYIENTGSLVKWFIIKPLTLHSDICDAIPSRAAAVISRRTTIWATICSSSSSIRP